ncbi:hypothetical protein B0O99DRAFT_703116, partial [Bisporella sp. PMI_857]
RCSAGVLTAVGIPITWVVSNQPCYAKRALANDVQIMVCNSAGIAAPFLYASSQAPGYRTSYASTIGLLGLAISIYFLVHIYYRRQNASRNAGKQEWRIQGKSKEEIAERGEQNPRFRFTV